MNLTEMRARVREDLQDTDDANYRWSNDEVDGAIERVVREFSRAYPIQQQDEITTTEDDKELDISSLSSLLKVVSVEYPTDQDPPHYQRFDFWADKLYMQDEGDGSNKARVRWYKSHTLDAEGSTIPTEHEEIIVMGATGYLAISASAYTVDKASIGGRYATVNFRIWGQGRLNLYRQKLKVIARTNRVITGELYTDD